jgi:hypothetical protein
MKHNHKHHNNHIHLTEAQLQEANRQQLLAKSRKAKKYSKTNQSKGINRYERRLKSQLSASVKDYNVIDMDRFFKRDTLSFSVPVRGETDVYLVSLELQGILTEVQRQIRNNKGKLEFKVILSSLSAVLNTGDVYTSCTCPDATYRQAYWQTRNNYKAGYKELRPSNDTNPQDELGAGCKHVMLVLANLSWMYKVASVINNYIKYSRDRLQKNYIDYIFPKVFGMKYDKAVQLQLFYSDEESGLLPTDQETISKAIEQGLKDKDTTGKFVPGNTMRFQKPQAVQTEEEPEEEIKEEELNNKF